MGGSNALDETAGSNPRVNTPFRETWDTKNVRPLDRFDYFREGVCQTFHAHTPERPDDDEMNARIDRVQAGDGWLGRSVQTPHRSKRTKIDIAKDSGEAMSVGIIVSGSAELCLADGSRHTQKRGDLFLSNYTELRHIEMSPPEQYAMVRVLFPKNAIDDIASPELLHGFTKFQKGQGHDALAGSILLLSRRALVGNAVEVGALHAAVTSLVVANLAQDRDCIHSACDTSSAACLGLLASMKAVIERNISEPTMSPGFVAAHFGISVRYVHKLFAKSGESFNTAVVAYRLEGIMADLLDPRYQKANIGDIARKWGFHDLTSFYRNFKLRFNDTPKAVRSTARTPYRASRTSVKPETADQDREAAPKP